MTWPKVEQFRDLICSETLSTSMQVEQGDALGVHVAKRDPLTTCPQGSMTPVRRTKKVRRTGVVFRSPAEGKMRIIFCL